MAHSRNPQNVSARDAAVILKSFVESHKEIADYLPESLAYFIEEIRPKPSQSTFKSQSIQAMGDTETLTHYNRLTNFFAGTKALPDTREARLFAEETLARIIDQMHQTNENVTEGIFIGVLSSSNLDEYRETQSLKLLQTELQKSIKDQQNIFLPAASAIEPVELAPDCKLYNHLAATLQEHSLIDFPFTYDPLFAKTILEKMHTLDPDQSFRDAENLDLASQQKMADTLEIAIEDVEKIISSPPYKILSRVARDKQYKDMIDPTAALTGFLLCLKQDNISDTEDFLSQMSDATASIMIRHFIASLNNLYQLEPEEEKINNSHHKIIQHISPQITLASDITIETLSKPADRSPTPNDVLTIATPTAVATPITPTVGNNTVSSPQPDAEVAAQSLVSHSTPFMSLANDMAEETQEESKEGQESRREQESFVSSSFQNPLFSYLQNLKPRSFSPDLESDEMSEAPTSLQAEAAASAPHAMAASSTIMPLLPEQPSENSNAVSDRFFLQELKNRLVAFGMYFSSQIDAAEASKRLADQKSWRKFLLKPITYWKGKGDAASENRAKHFIHDVTSIPARNLTDTEERMAIETLRKLFVDFVDLLPPTPNSVERTSFNDMTKGLISETTTRLKIACAQIAKFFFSVYTNVSDNHGMLQSIDRLLMLTAQTEDNDISDAEKFALLRAELETFIQETGFEIQLQISNNALSLALTPNEIKRQLAIETYMNALDECRILGLTDHILMAHLKDSMQKVVGLDLKNAVYGAPMLPLLLSEVQDHIAELKPVLLNALKKAEDSKKTATVGKLKYASQYVASFFYKKQATIEKPNFQERRLNNLEKMAQAIQEKPRSP